MHICLVCGKEIKNEKEFLSHIAIVHNIKCPEDYEKKAEEKRQQDQKDAEYHKKFKELVDKVNSSEITISEYKQRRTELERVYGKN